MTISINQFHNKNKDTICAVITPHGIGGVSVIRISGESSLKFIKVLSKRFDTNDFESHRCYYSILYDRNGQPIDEVLFTYFKSGKSFTSEETVEISCHGNPILCNAIIIEIIFLGARHADRGEFTFRAFINGRLDLTQAEAVLDLIQASSQSASKKALRQLDGALSDKISKLEDLLTWCLAHIEASIDFSSEGLDVVDENVLILKINEVLNETKILKSNYNLANQIRNGLRVALVGEPNVGKSSLLNLVLMKDRALVSNQAGTTRDSIDGEVQFNNILVNFVDTAGIRSTEDSVEKLGVEKTFKEIEGADLLIYVFDAEQLINNPSSIFLTSSTSFLKSHNPQQILVLLNKADLLNENQKSILLELLFANDFFKESKVLYTSAASKAESHLEREKILLSVLEMSQIKQAMLNDFILINHRQFECLSLIERNIESSLNVLNENSGSEFVAFELKEALMAMQELIGKRFDDQIMDRVFKEFCIGK